MPRSITPGILSAHLDAFVIVDVRKQPARMASGLTIPGAIRRLPDDVRNWLKDLDGRPVVAFCAHGHEISQTVGETLAAAGIDAVYLAGGFEGWKDAGHDVVAIEERG